MHISLVWVIRMLFELPDSLYEVVNKVIQKRPNFLYPLLASDRWSKLKAFRFWLTRCESRFGLGIKSWHICDEVKPKRCVPTTRMHLGVPCQYNETQLVVFAAVPALRFCQRSEVRN